MVTAKQRWIAHKICMKATFISRFILLKYFVIFKLKLLVLYGCLKKLPLHPFIKLQRSSLQLHSN